MEIKTSAAFMRDAWAKGPPIYYQVQLQIQMHALGLKWGVLCVMFGGRDIEWYIIDYDQKAAMLMLERACEFWNEYVEPNKEPPVSNAADGSLLGVINQPCEDKAVDLGVEFIQLDAEIQQAKEAARTAREHEGALTARLKQAIGNAEIARLPSGVAYSFKTVEKKPYTVKAQKYRMLRRHAPKNT